MKRIRPDLDRGYGGPNQSHVYGKKASSNAGAYKRTGKNYKKAGIWWCNTCCCVVPPEHVTFEETHDPRYGGCGWSL